MAPTPQQLQNTALDYLQTQLNGELITPNAPTYDEARQVFFKGVDKRPLAVARVAGADDVAAVVKTAREGGLELAVRSGGHSRPGYGTVDNGLVVDLSGMDDVELDADAQTAWVETGATASRYTLATGAEGRATGLGDTGSVGIGGIALAGGIGFLVRKTGLTIDNLLAAQVVTADGEIVQASEDSEPDLFWAIRGGEGNFGVATRLQLRLTEISEIVGGMLMLPASAQVITGFLEAAQAAPEELSTIANVMIAPPLPFVPAEIHGKPVLMGQFAYVGTADRGEEVIAPFRALAETLADTVRPMRYPELYDGPGAGGSLRGRHELLRRLAHAGGRRGHPREAAHVDGADEGRPAAGARGRDGAGPERRHGVCASRSAPVRERSGDVHGRRRKGHP